MVKKQMRTYSELIQIPTFEERYKYLRISGSVGADTFGFDRYLNQTFYKSAIWRRLRNQIIVRDNGCDLADLDHPIYGKIIIHHMNPVDTDDVIYQREILLNPDYLICVSHITHNAIHYGSEELLPSDLIERKPNDTCPWKK